LFTDSCEVFERAAEDEPDKALQATDTFKTTITWLIKSEQYARAFIPAPPLMTDH
jgi:hypothetical protein